MVPTQPPARSLTAPPRAPLWSQGTMVPKLVTALAEGYRLDSLRADLIAGFTVAIVALPLSMALAIASGAAPADGLVTAVVAGFVISALGGSRVQVGGPTGAFVVVVMSTIRSHGYDGLVLATLLAGAMILAAGVLRLGSVVRYVPQPVIVGFTAAIALIIATTQVATFLGLETGGATAGSVIEGWQQVAASIATLSPLTLGVGLGTLALIFALRRWAPRLPGLLIAIAAAALVVAVVDPRAAEVATLHSRFGDLPAGLPMPRLPAWSWDKVVAVLPDAATIAFLAALEALLSAIIADGMTGRRHRSNIELVAQGVANLMSALFGGLPATGALARTATNVRAGARTPVAGIAHAGFVLAFMMLGGDLVGYIPLAALSAVLFAVAWGMADLVHVGRLLRGAPWEDRVTLLTAFALTVLVDITVAIEVSVVLAALLFMARMARLVEIQAGAPPMADADPAADDTPRVDRTALPPGVEVFTIRGPLFFAATGALSPAFDRSGRWPRLLVLDLAEVPFVDASGIQALEDLSDRARRQGGRMVVAAAPARVTLQLQAAGRAGAARLELVASVAAALEAAAATDPTAPWKGARADA